jgi:hypothetical protein
MRAIEERRVGSRDMSRGSSRFFDLHGFEFPFPPPLIEKLAAALSVGGDDANVAIAETVERLDARLMKIMGDEGFDEGIWANCAVSERSRVLADMAMLLAMGVFRHPTGRSGDA